MPDSTAANAQFLTDFPQYAGTSHLDELRASEYPKLDEQGHVYLDYTGAGLHSTSQTRQHLEQLGRQLLGNPHSAHRASRASTALVERTRRCILAQFNAAPEDYVVVLTANATGALKLVGEAYPFESAGSLLLTADNHNSVNGIREYARRQQVPVHYVPFSSKNLRIAEASLTAALSKPPESARGLFAFPAQSNFSGAQHDLQWVCAARALGWDVLLDAAAFAPTNSLDLRRYPADYVTLSFYKMFGYPTGVGCLIARREALEKLERPWFAGGTVNYASVADGTHELMDGAEAFEDGTLNYASAAAVEFGFRHLASAGIDAIHTRVQCLTAWLLRELQLLAHENGTPVVRLYGPADNRMRGGTIALNLVDKSGELICPKRVEQLAVEDGISVRTGCFCNPGAAEFALGVLGSSYSKRNPGQGGIEGALRVSFGLVSNFEDAWRFLRFVSGFVRP